MNFAVAQQYILLVHVLLRIIRNVPDRYSSYTPTVRDPGMLKGMYE